jgi:hypothetical protein
MATKRKTKKKQTKSQAKSKRALAKKVMPTKKRAKKSAIPKKRLAKRKAAPTKPVAKRKVSKKAMSGKAAGRKTRKSQGRDAFAFPREAPGSHPGEQSGDLQGLSNVEGADSESVDELLEEGNAFEAGVVSGVEDAGKRGVREVRTREVPEDDVPSEYLDED